MSMTKPRIAKMKKTPISTRQRATRDSERHNARLSILDVRGTGPRCYTFSTHVSHSVRDVRAARRSLPADVVQELQREIERSADVVSEIRVQGRLQEQIGERARIPMRDGEARDVRIRRVEHHAACTIGALP